jgi:hypothetical protein
MFQKFKTMMARVSSTRTDETTQRLQPHKSANQIRGKFYFASILAMFFATSVLAESTEKVPLIGELAKVAKTFYISSFLSLENFLGLSTTIVFLITLWALYWRTYNQYVAVIHEKAFVTSGLRYSQDIIKFILMFVFPALIFFAIFFPEKTASASVTNRLFTSIWAFGLTLIFFLFIPIGIFLNSALKDIMKTNLNMEASDFPYLTRATEGWSYANTAYFCQAGCIALYSNQYGKNPISLVLVALQVTLVASMLLQAIRDRGPSGYKAVANDVVEFNTAFDRYLESNKSKENATNSEGVA